MKREDLTGIEAWAADNFQRRADGTWVQCETSLRRSNLNDVVTDSIAGVWERNNRGWVHTSRYGTGQESFRGAMEAFGVNRLMAEQLDDEAQPGEIVAPTRMSTRTPDRTSYSINQEGFELDNFRNNPVVLFAHESNRPPVGQMPAVFLSPSSTGEQGAELRGVIRFARPDTYEFGATIGRLVRDRFLRATSVGFDPIEVRVAEERITDPDDIMQLLFPPLDFIRQELLEDSVVPIPANAEALIEMQKRGDPDLAQLQGWATRILDEGGALVVPREVLEPYARAGKPARIQLEMTPMAKPAKKTDRNVQVRVVREDGEDQVTPTNPDDVGDQEEVASVAREDEPENVPETPPVPPQENEVGDDPADLPEKPTFNLDEMEGRCPSCGFEHTMNGFLVPEEEEAARSMSDDVILREMRRRGFAVDTNDDTPLPLGLDADDLGGIIREEVGRAISKLSGKLS